MTYKIVFGITTMILGATAFAIISFKGYLQSWYVLASGLVFLIGAILLIVGVETLETRLKKLNEQIVAIQAIQMLSILGFNFSENNSEGDSSL